MRPNRELSHLLWVAGLLAVALWKLLVLEINQLKLPTKKRLASKLKVWWRGPWLFGNLAGCLGIGAPQLFSTRIRKGTQPCVRQLIACRRASQRAKFKHIPCSSIYRKWSKSFKQTWRCRCLIQCIYLWELSCWGLLGPHEFTTRKVHLPKLLA